MTAYWVAPPIQVCGPGLEEPGSNSSLRDRMDGIQTQEGESDAGNV